MDGEQMFVKVVDTEHLFVLQCQRSEQMFEEGDAMSVALELEYEAFYPRLQLVSSSATGGRASLSKVHKRRFAFVAALAILFILLMLPLRALGGQTVAGASPTAGQVYVVQSGDTLHSIAARADSSNIAGMTHRLAAEVGSDVVVPGEHLRIP
jgi:hypothetical protein